MRLSGKYYGKILLFGEYTVLRGGTALTLPYKDVAGYFDFFDASPTPLQIQSNKELKRFCAFLQSFEFIDTEAITNDIEKGLFFNSTIPVGYGVGSSGALVAAIFDQYYKLNDFETNDLQWLRHCFAKIEAYFHGNSSGIDPLCSYIAKPLIISGEKIQIVNSAKFSGFNFFLIDTGKPGSTSAMVKVFNKKCADKEFCNLVDNELCQANMMTVNALITGDNKNFNDGFRTISQIQFEHFMEMIPEKIHPLWQKGLETGDFFLKLCGSGGGGYLIGITTVSEDLFTLDFPLIWLISE